MSIKFPEHFPSKEKMIEILHKTIEKSWKNNYSSNNIERWLSNFDGRVFSIDEEQRLALWLLCNYTYYSSEDVNHLCRVLYNKLIHDMISNNFLNLNAFNEDIKNVYFSSIGSASDSGGLILYHFRQESMLSVDRFVYPSTVKPNDKNILVFIDDVTIRVYNAPHNSSGIGMYSEDGVLVGDYRIYKKDYKKSKTKDNIYIYKRKE